MKNREIKRRIRAIKAPALLAALVLLLAALGGCTAAPPGDGAIPAEATMVPEIAPQMEEDVSPGETPLIEQRTVSLYFRFQGENMLAAEPRTLWIPRDKQVEKTLIEALIIGPSAGQSELTGLFPSGTKVIKAWSNGDILTVLLSRGFLATPSDVPASWLVEPAWRTEVFARRQLALASVVNVITEETDYTSVQFLVAESDDDPTGRRLLLSELYDDVVGNDPLAPMVRSEHFILTHYNTATMMLDSWQTQTYDRMYRMLAQYATQRPVDAMAFSQEMAMQCRRLISYWLTPGTVASDGQSAVVEVSYEYIAGGEMRIVENFPLRLIREQGLWKVAHGELWRMMEAE